MPPSQPPVTVHDRAISGPAHAVDRTEAAGCAVCGLARAEHGVHLLHRFVSPGRAVASR